MLIIQKINPFNSLGYHIYNEHSFQGYLNQQAVH